MKKTFCAFIFLLIIPLFSFAKPAFVVAPFLQSLTLANNTSADVAIVIQNNTTVNQTITNLTPQIPPDSLVTATIVENHCGLLSPNENCDALFRLTSLNTLGNGKLNLSVCSFNGSLCSRIVQDITVLNTSLASIDVFPTNSSIASGTTEQFSAFGKYSDGSTQDITNTVTWSSSDITKATISNTSGSQGLASGVAAGNSTITASLNNVSGSTTLTVTAATLSSITVIPATSTIANGTTQQFYAIGIYSDNSHQNLTSQVTWSSSDPSIATISNVSGSAGQATGKGVGSATLTASFGAVSGTAALSVTAATLSEITVTPAAPSIANGEELQFHATGIYTDNTTIDLTNVVTWSTSSALIAVISNLSAHKGLALARNVGTTTVTAQLGNLSGTTDLQVTAAVLQAIDVSPEITSLAAGETQQYTATGIFSDNSIQDISNNVFWGSSDNSIATVSNLGLATGVALGTASISAMQQGITGTASLIVRAATLLSIAVTPSNPTIQRGTQQQFTATGTYSDASTKDLTTQATWLSNTPTTAVISNAPGTEGVASALSAGSTTIRAISSGVTGSTTLTVTIPTLTSIAITPANASIPTLTSMQYKATGTYSDASTKDLTQEVTWRSSNILRAIISNFRNSKGVVVGISSGSTTISASLNGISGTTSLSIASVNIGDSLNGGIVGCLSGGINNLVVANTNNSTGIVWGGSGTATNAQSQVNGATNTSTIVSVLGAGTTYAAGLCDAYEIDSAGNSPCVGGNTCYNDWFLASTNQTSCLQNNRNQIDGFDRALYWTSTEYSLSSRFNAYSQTFANGGNGPSPSSKSDLNEVRCVRLINGTS